MENCTECISYIKGEPVCGNDIKIGKLPEKTRCRKWLKHIVIHTAHNGERHYLKNLAGRTFDITDQVMAQAKKNDGNGVEKHEK